MDDGLKQRIVGAFVLVAIGVVFIPVVFDRERIEALDRKTQIPPAPHMEPMEVAAPIQPKTTEAVSQPSEAFIPDEKQVQNEAVVPQVLSEQGTPNSWVLQIASYRYEDHAKEKRDELIKQGYSAYIRKVNTEQGNMSRLFVGPNLDKKKLLAAQKSLDSQLDVRSILLKFQP